MGTSHKQIRNIRIRAGVQAVELARQSGIDRSRLSLFESGTVELSEAQLAKLKDSLLKELVKRMEGFRAAIKMLKETEATKKVAAGAGAPDGQGSESRCEERNDAG